MDLKTVEIFIILVMLFLGIEQMNNENLEIGYLVLAVLIAYAVTASVKWYKEKGKDKILIFFGKLKDLPTDIFKKSEKIPKNYAMAAAVKDGRIDHCFFALSNEAILEEIGAYNGISCTVCNNHSELSNGKIKKYDPDGEEIEEYSIYTEYEKIHATCAEKKIIAKFVEKYNSDEIDYLILYTCLEMCSSCREIVAYYKAMGYKITVIDQAWLSRICDEAEEDEEVSKEEVDFLKDVLNNLEKIYKIKKVRK